MPEAETPSLPESPQLARERLAALVASSLILLALPTLVLLILDVSESAVRAKAIWLVATAAGAVLLPLLFWSPFRVLGFVPYGAIGWLAAVGHGAYWNEWLAWAHGVPVGLMVGALARGQRGPQPVWEVAVLAGGVLVGLLAAWMFRERGRPFDIAVWFVLAAAVALVGWSCVRLFRPWFEVTLEPLLWVMYRVRGTGPGLAEFPQTGPVLVIANHACWLDPIFLAKVLPRPVTPMMTSRFYDLPFMRRLMVLFGVIRVPEKAVKKDTPEIQEAIAALDRGECVVIFPEGYLRRSEDRVLRRFGQGIWQILQARPNTPVFATWIEGGWGSYTSYQNGPPTKNKTKDFGRPIGVGMSAAVTVPPELLQEHLNTRIYLMNLVSDARKHLGLEPLSPFALPEKAEEGESESE